MTKNKQTITRIFCVTALTKNINLMGVQYDCFIVTVHETYVERAALLTHPNRRRVKVGQTILASGLMALNQRSRV